MVWGWASAASSPATGLKPVADGTRNGLPPSGYRSVKGSTSNRGEAPEESRVVRLVHPKAEAVPVPIGIGACGIIRPFARSV